MSHNVAVFPMDTCHIKVESIKGKGRGLVATKDLKPGDTVLVEKPYSFCLSRSCEGNRCDYCFSNKEDLRRCSQCKHQRYCNKTCQKAAWTLHKYECKNLPKLTTNAFSLLPEAILLFTRLLRKIEIEKKEGRQPDKTDGFPQSINDLIDIYELWNEQQKVRCEFERKELELFLGRKIIKQEFNHLASRVYCNALFIGGPKIDPLGPGIYLKASLINNCCDFNSTTLYDGTTLSLRATRPIMKGQEITISYLSALQPSHIRRQMLQEKYCFTCNCPRCENKELDAKLQSIACEKCKGQVLRKKYKTFMKCNACDQLPSQKHVSAILAIEAESSIFVEETINLKPISDRQFTYALDLTRRQKCFLHRLHYLRAKTFDKVGHICFNMKNFNDGIPMLEEVISTYEILYPPYQSLIGVYCDRLAAVYVQVLRFEEARERFIQALAALKITHGEGHPFYLETSKTFEAVVMGAFLAFFSVSLTFVCVSFLQGLDVVWAW